MKKFFKGVATHLADAFFPRKCVGCHTTGTLLCARCEAHIPSAPPAEQPFIRAVFDYRHPTMRDAIWRFKYKNACGFAEVFAPRLYDEIVGELGDSLDAAHNRVLLVPIPLHKKRLRERGYNQSELLARALVRLDGARTFTLAPNLLVRTRATLPQARSEKRAARLENLRGAFASPDSARVRGRTVILIDDVTTTGATLLAAHRTLASAKPRKVLAFAVAH